MTMAQTILEYLNKRFGKEMVSRMAKLSEEFEELQNAFHYGSREDFIDELADLNGVLYHITGIMGLDQDELLKMMMDKISGREKDPDYKRKHRHIRGLATLETQLRILKEVEKTYPTSSIGNVITQIESRINHLKK